MPKRTWVDSFLDLLRTQAEPRYYKLAEDGYLLGIGAGAGGTEITKEEYGRIEAVIAAKPVPPEGCDYRLREDLQWQTVVLPEPEEEPLDPARALELICGTSRLTKAQADEFSAKLAREERKEKKEE